MVGVLGRDQQRRIGEVRRICIELGRAGKGGGKKRGRADVGVAEPANQAKGRAQESRRRTQPRNFGIELIGREFLPLQLEERLAGLREEEFRFDVVDEHDLAPVCAQQFDGVLAERTRR